jgi:hypothetical protein
MSDIDYLKKQLEAIQNQLNQIEKTQNTVLESQKRTIQKETMETARQERVSYFVFVTSLLMSSLVGVAGNWFVTLLFQPTTSENTIGLGLSGGLLISFLAALFVELRWVWREMKRFR